MRLNMSHTDLVAKHAPTEVHHLRISDLPRSKVIKYMIVCTKAYVKDLRKSSSFTGIIFAGGSEGTSPAAAMMREAPPIGSPKLIVSTVASGDTRLIFEETDVTLMYSVVNIGGLNSLLKSVWPRPRGLLLVWQMHTKPILWKPRQSN